MAKNDTDLFDRLRRVGLRKKAAKALSDVSHTAGDKTQRAARAAAHELRALADEIERRLPAEPASEARAKRTPAPRAGRAKAANTRSSAAKSATTAKRTSRGSTARTSSGSRSPTPSATTERTVNGEAP